MYTSTELPPGVRERAPLQVDVFLLVLADDVAALAFDYVAVVYAEILLDAAGPEVAHLALAYLEVPE
jgi:hypothetical protein